MVIIMQLFEWYLTLYIIDTQKNRRVEEIMYDHNHENLAEKISESQINYRKREMRIEKYAKPVFYLL